MIYGDLYQTIQANLIDLDPKGLWIFVTGKNLYVPNYIIDNYDKILKKVQEFKHSERSLTNIGCDIKEDEKIELSLPEWYLKRFRIIPLHQGF